MTKKELNKYLDKYVEIEFKDDIYIGTLKCSGYGNSYYDLPEHRISFKTSAVISITLIKERKNKTPQEIKKWLLENCVDENNDINLSGLDFSDYKGNIIINHLKVKQHLYQNYQEVGWNIYQNNQKSRYSIIQDNQEAKKIYNDKENKYE